MFKKYIALLVLLSFTCIAAHAQSDTLLYYLNSGNQIVDKDQADHYVVIAPTNSNALYPVYEFYLNGKRKMVATSYTASPQYLLHGTAMHYFPDGKRKAVATYKIGAPVTEINYYPNGKIYSLISYADGVRSYQTCSDTSGNALTIDGNGKWLTYNNDMTQITGGGQIVKGKPEGEWQETLGDSIKSTIMYHKGVIRSGLSIDQNGKTYQFKEAIVKPTSTQANAELTSALRVYLKDHPQPPFNFPRPLVSFWVNADGFVSDVKALSNDNSSMDQWAIKVVTRSLWKPGSHNGVPVRMLQYYPGADNAVGVSIREVKGEVRGVNSMSRLPKPGANINSMSGVAIIY